MTSAGVDARILAALEQSAGEVRVCGAGAWVFTLPHGVPLPVSARRRDVWLELRAPGLTGVPAWDLLRRNAALRGEARVVLAGAAPEVVVDLPCADEDGMADRLAAACEAVVRAAEGIAPPGAGSEAATAPDPVWSRTLSEHGWTLAQRGDGRLAVELDAPGLAARAHIEHIGADVSVSAEILRIGAAATAAREAMARYALTVTGLVRMVRAAAGGEPEALRLEVRLGSPSSGTDLALAVSALSVAYRRAGRELRALADPAMAATYLHHLTTEG